MPILSSSPDSFRVISEDAHSDHPKYKPLPYRASFEPRTPTPKVFKASNNDKESPLEPTLPALPLKTTRVLPQLLPDFRGNKPQPLSCGFLDRNVRFLNEPICNVSWECYFFLILQGKYLFNILCQTDFITIRYTFLDRAKPYPVY